MNDNILIRASQDDDVAAITAIYAHHVTHGLASFEEDAPGEAEMRRRRTALVDAGRPYLVACAGGEVVGYAYVGPYRSRPAYRYAVENSVYVAPGQDRRGIGRGLLARLIDESSALGYRQMIAIIGDSANLASITLHERLGFTRAGDLRSVGLKFGRWVDSVLMQRELGDGDGTLPPRAP